MRPIQTAHGIAAAWVCLAHYSCYFLSCIFTIFWVPSRFGGIGSIHELDEITLTDYNNQAVHDLFTEMKVVFSENIIVVIAYLLGLVSLGWHLLHGFQSAFQTLGLNHNRYTPIIKGVGAAFSIIVPLIFALMPLAIYFNWIS